MSEYDLLSHVNVIYFDIVNMHQNNKHYLVVYVSKRLYNLMRKSLMLEILNVKNIFLILDKSRRGLSYGYTNKKNLINNVNKFFEKN